MVKKSEVSIGIEVSASAVYSEATAKRLIEDAIFLHTQALNSEDELEKKRFSRLSIMVIPFYLESLSNYLFDIYYDDRKIEDIDSEGNVPKTIRKFRKVFEKLLGKKLKDKDTDGIRDIFTIRNKIIAHPAGRSNLTAIENGWERDDKNISYFKFKSLPKVYSHFNLEHTYAIFKEAHDFLRHYITSIKPKLTVEQYNYVWPKELKELIDWKLTHTPRSKSV